MNTGFDMEFPPSPDVLVRLISSCSSSSVLSSLHILKSHNGNHNIGLEVQLHLSGKVVEVTLQISREYFLIRQVRRPNFQPRNLFSIFQPSSSSNCVHIRLVASVPSPFPRLSRLPQLDPPSPIGRLEQDSESRGVQQSSEIARGTTEDSPIGINHSLSQPGDATTTGSCRSHGSGEWNPTDDANRVQVFRSFNLFGRPKSARQINEAIKVELLKPCPAATQGFIYGFSHPERRAFVKLGTEPIIQTELLKIGRSTNVERRMRQWRRQCKYTPRLEFAHAMPQHHKIERVVHHQLHNARLREHLGCSGCGARHQEWFRVEAGCAQALVAMWRGFAEQQPYDGLGNMLPDWLERLDIIDLADPDCWSCFTRELILPIDPVIVHPGGSTAEPRGLGQLTAHLNSI